MAKKDVKPSAANVDKKQDDDLGGLGKVIVRNEFYRDGYRSLLKIALIQVFVIIGLIGAMFFVIQAHQPEIR